MKAQERPGQYPGNSSSDAQMRLEQQRQALRREAKRVIRRVVRLGEDAAFKGALEVLRIARKLNGPIRRRLELDD